MHAELFKKVCAIYCDQMAFASTSFEEIAASVSQSCCEALENIFSGAPDSTLASQCDKHFLPGGQLSGSRADPLKQNHGARAVVHSLSREGNTHTSEQRQHASVVVGENLHLRHFLESNGFTKCAPPFPQHAMQHWCSNIGVKQVQ
jgi:hypothetical protein